MPKVILLAQASSIHTCRWAAGLAGMGYEIVVVSVEDILEEYRSAKTFRFIKLPKIAGGLSYFANVWNLKKILKQERPDLLHTHFASGYGILATLSGFHPRILSVWGSDIMEFPERSKIHRLVSKFNLSHSDKILSTSESLAQATRSIVRDLSPERSIEITPFGVDCKVFAPSGRIGRSGPLILGTAKVLEPIYGIDLLLKAFKNLVDAWGPQSAFLKIAGGGSHEAAYKKLSRDLGIEHQVEFLGRLSHSEIPRFLNSLDLFCCLSRAESFGVSVIEAEACGVPVIASRVGGLVEVVQEGKTGWLVDSYDANCLVTALGKNPISRQVLEGMSPVAAHFVESHYSWSNSLKKMDEIYQQVIH